MENENVAPRNGWRSLPAIERASTGRGGNDGRLRLGRAFVDGPHRFTICPSGRLLLKYARYESLRGPLEHFHKQCRGTGSTHRGFSVKKSRT